MPKSPLRVFNPTPEDFTVNFNKKPYTVKSADYSKELSQHIAVHVAKHLVDYIMNKKNLPTNKEPERNQILSEVLTA